MRYKEIERLGKKVDKLIKQCEQDLKYLIDIARPTIKKAMEKK